MKIYLILLLLFKINLVISQTPGTVKWVFQAYSDIQSTPAIGFDGTIYFGSRDHRVYALNPDGIKKWDFNAGGDVYASPAIGVDGTIYVGTHMGKFLALNPDGTQKWEYIISRDIWSSAAIGNNGEIIFGASDSTLYALDNNGQKLWDFKANGRIGSSPAISLDGTIYFGSDDSTLYALYSDGTEKWVFKTNSKINTVSPAIAHDGTIYIGTYDYLLFAINPDGTKKWHYYIGGIPGNSPTIAATGTIYIGTIGPNFKLFAITPEGNKQWEIGTSGTNSTASIGHDGTIYIGTNGNKLLAINPDGSIKWEFQISSGIVSPPVLTSDSLILCGTSTPVVSLYALYCENNRYAESAWPKFRHDNLNSGNMNKGINTISKNKVGLSPEKFRLYSIYPNPFNSSAQITYSLKKRSHVKIEVFNLSGQMIELLLDESKHRGEYQLTWSPSSNGTGVYFIRAQVEGNVHIRKCALLR